MSLEEKGRYGNPNETPRFHSSICRGLGLLEFGRQGPALGEEEGCGLRVGKHLKQRQEMEGHRIGGVCLVKQSGYRLETRRKGLNGFTEEDRTVVQGLLLVEEKALLVELVLVHEVISKESLSAILADTPAFHNRCPDIVEESAVLLQVSGQHRERVLAQDKLSIGIAIHIRVQEVVLDNLSKVPHLVAGMPTRVLQNCHGVATMG
jgi:hypothetical protein